MPATPTIFEIIQEFIAAEGLLVMIIQMVNVKTQPTKK
jgi:hypothetical protein